MKFKLTLYESELDFLIQLPAAWSLHVWFETANPSIRTYVFDFRLKPLSKKPSALQEVIWRGQEGGVKPLGVMRWHQSRQLLITLSINHYPSRPAPQPSPHRIHHSAVTRRARDDVTVTSSHGGATLTALPPHSLDCRDETRVMTSLNYSQTKTILDAIFCFVL